MLRDNPAVQAALQKQSHLISDFWCADPKARIQGMTQFIGRSVVVIDAEDAFTEMLAQQLKAIGLNVTISNSHKFTLCDQPCDLVVMGPGPGDPSNMRDQRIASLRKLMSTLLAKKFPFMAVCLSHQMLSLELGLPLIRKNPPNQGVQFEIDFFGVKERVGFYNTYAAICDQQKTDQLKKMQITVCKDELTNEVYALRGPYFSSIQFHAESLLTRNGIGIISTCISKALKI